MADDPGAYADADHAAAQALVQLLQLMRTLRDPEGGCPWDQRQSFGSIAPYTIEEAYEVADAIERNDPAALRDELGDLLFQVVFHARLAQEAGSFDFAAAANSIVAKLQRRHPHVFAAAAQADWEDLKADERVAAGARSALAGVALGLPALSRAAKLGKRAARVNFDWQDLQQVRAKIDEELTELDAAIDAAEGETRIDEELGDLLFAVAQWARFRGLDPEAALRRANSKFVKRFMLMEHMLANDGAAAAELDFAQWEVLWQRAKAGLAARQSDSVPVN